MNQLPFMHESYEKHYFELTAINTFMLLTHTNVRVDRETLQLHIVAQKVVTSHVTNPYMYLQFRSAFQRYNNLIGWVRVNLGCC